MSVHLKKWAPLPSFTDRLWDGKPVTTQPSQRSWTHHLVEFMDEIDAEVQYHLLKRVLSIKKITHTWELWVMFHLGHNEGCSLGDSITDSTEKLTSLWTPALGSPSYLLCQAGPMAQSSRPAPAPTPPAHVDPRSMKNVENRWLLEKCKSKLQWSTTSY